MFSWDKKVNEAWERIMTIIALDIKLTIPQREEQLVLTCDASKVAISCILWVEQKNDLRVVGCYSKLFSHTDSLKSIHFKETYAMVEGFRHYRPYLLSSSKSIIVFTDARSLMWVSRNREYSIACNGLVNKLAQIQLEIPHIVYSVPSEVNYLADLFSRAFQDSRFIEKSY
ncbi:MAG: RNase H-like domain-containing protein, partial [bacterium]